MALFGDLATNNKMVLYIVTQQISLWIRLCGYVCEMRGSDVTVTVRARINKHTLFNAGYDKPKKIMSESYVYTAFYELCYSTKGQFATLIWLKQFAKSGVYDTRKTNRDDSQGLRYSFITQLRTR